MPSNFMTEIKQESDFKLESGVRVRLYREEPFKFFSKIEGWMKSLNIGEPLAFQMNTDTNGWINFAVAYREYKAPITTPIDPNLVMLDIVSVLKDVVDALDGKLLKSPAVTQKQEPAGAD